jgi:hypothetical protein
MNSLEQFLATIEGKPADHLARNLSWSGLLHPPASGYGRPVDLPSIFAR